MLVFRSPSAAFGDDSMPDPVRRLHIAQWCLLHEGHEWWSQERIRLPPANLLRELEVLHRYAGNPVLLRWIESKSSTDILARIDHNTTPAVVVAVLQLPFQSPPIELLQVLLAYHDQNAAVSESIFEHILTHYPKLKACVDAWMHLQTEVFAHEHHVLRSETSTRFLTLLRQLLSLPPEGRHWPPDLVAAMVPHVRQALMSRAPMQTADRAFWSSYVQDHKGELIAGLDPTDATLLRTHLAGVLALSENHHLRLHAMLLHQGVTAGFAWERERCLDLLRNPGEVQGEPASAACTQCAEVILHNNLDLVPRSGVPKWTTLLPQWTPSASDALDWISARTVTPSDLDPVGEWMCRVLQSDPPYDPRVRNQWRWIVIPYLAPGLAFVPWDTLLCIMAGATAEDFYSVEEIAAVSEKLEKIHPVYHAKYCDKLLTFYRTATLVRGDTTDHLWGHMRGRLASELRHLDDL